MGIEKTHATSMRPQANGLVERFNRTLIFMLKAYCKTNQDKWDIYLQQVMMAYRSSIHSSTKLTPIKMVFGREVVLPMQAVIGRPVEDEHSSGNDDYVIDLQDKLHKCHEIARDNLMPHLLTRKSIMTVTAKESCINPDNLPGYMIHLEKLMLHVRRETRLGHGLRALMIVKLELISGIQDGKTGVEIASSKAKPSKSRSISREKSTGADSRRVVEIHDRDDNRRSRDFDNAEKRDGRNESRKFDTEKGEMKICGMIVSAEGQIPGEIETER
ncbi:uncharacterized protein LOC128548103 [Mercenaria mercenaria]|uniref:uncharacterized protein LOC128548103 n=1 Tax=Mercenaria mercenaria TaxID=6596 RepID=UPI00234E8FC8|nr:uncharacterized protein LOC128548103 [Mercenaria mercenaria]